MNEELVRAKREQYQKLLQETMVTGRTLSEYIKECNQLEREIYELENQKEEEKE